MKLSDALRSDYRAAGRWNSTNALCEEVRRRNDGSPCCLDTTLCPLNPWMVKSETGRPVCGDVLDDCRKDLECRRFVEEVIRNLREQGD